MAASCDGDRWFQLYIVERQAAWDMIRRALETGYSTLVVTVDVAVNGLRERDIRNGFGMPLRYTPRILLDGALHPHWTLNLLRHGMPQLANFVTARSRDAHSQAALLKRQMDASFDWDALRQIRDLWPRRLLVKGLLNPQDASRAIALGADGVIVSNHGGRQLDSAPSPMTVLDAMVAAAKGAPVLVDSGFRRGADVVKALAMGASAILIGRPLLYGMAAAGGDGVDAVIAILRDEVDRTLAQIGCPEIGLLSRDFIMPAAPI
ncbi:(S)-mandelate dehydrogenase [Sphingobium sp. YG1]|nr:(S)-mandelate dehydrogenase [Sphingobium sp. YG1]